MSAFCIDVLVIQCKLHGLETRIIVGNYECNCSVCFTFKIVFFCVIRTIVHSFVVTEIEIKELRLQ